VNRNLPYIFANLHEMRESKPAEIWGGNKIRCSQKAL